MLLQTAVALAILLGPKPVDVIMADAQEHNYGLCLLASVVKVGLGGFKQQRGVLLLIGNFQLTKRFLHTLRALG